MIPELKELSYKERLMNLNLPSLVYRRRKADMIWVYKIVNGLVRVDCADVFTKAPERHTRGHTMKILK